MHHWAVGTRCRADRDVLLIPDWSEPGGLNPSAYEYFADGSKEARLQGDSDPGNAFLDHFAATDPDS